MLRELGLSTRSAERRLVSSHVPQSRLQCSGSEEGVCISGAWFHTEV